MSSADGRRLAWPPAAYQEVPIATAVPQAPPDPPAPTPVIIVATPTPVRYAPAVTPAAPPQTPQAIVTSAPAKVYTVVKGDTLAKIARTYGTTVAALQKLNGITNPNRIYPTQVLKIP